MNFLKTVVFGAIVVLLTSNPALAKWITYTSLTKGTWQVWIMDDATQKARQLTKGEEDKKQPRFSLDGKEITYRTITGHAYRISIKRGKPKRILKKIGFVTDVTLLSKNTALFTWHHGGTGKRSDIGIADLKTDKITWLVRGPNIYHDPRPTRDGKKVVFVFSHPKHHCQLYSINADGTGKKKLGGGPLDTFDTYPSWSPDGNMVAFSSSRAGGRDVWLINTDGSGLKRLTKFPGFEESPVFSPDGKRILFESNKGGTVELWSVDLNGQNPKQITNTGTGARDPDWW